MSETLFGGLSLQFGLFDWIEWDQAPASDIFEQRLQMLAYADQAGFYCYHLAEHHVTPLSVSPSPTVFLAAAQRTQRQSMYPLLCPGSHAKTTCSPTPNWRGIGGAQH